MEQQFEQTIILEHERREKFRRKSDRNFRWSITMMFALTFMIGVFVGYFWR